MTMMMMSTSFTRYVLFFSIPFKVVGWGVFFFFCLFVCVYWKFRVHRFNGFASSTLSNGPLLGDPTRIRVLGTLSGENFIIFVLKDQWLGPIRYYMEFFIPLLLFMDLSSSFV